jgi:hypothetical protein
MHATKCRFTFSNSIWNLQYHVQQSDISSTSAVCDTNFDFPSKDRMRRVFPSSRVFAECASQGNGIALDSTLLISLFVLIASLPLRAQSVSGQIFQLSKPTATSDLGSGLEIDARVFSFGRSLGQERRNTEAPAAIATSGNARIDPLSSRPFISFEKVRSEAEPSFEWSGCEEESQSSAGGKHPAEKDTSANDAGASSVFIARHHDRPDSNLDIYYRNRREFSLDVGWHPVNIPFIYDFAVGDSYNMTPLKYTLVPIVASLRWHVTNVGWKWIFRGNMDFTFSGALTLIPRGPETHYYSLDFGIRRNFVYRNWKVVPFFEQRGGAGFTNAKEPLGVQFAQGQNLTFTYNLGVGARYNIDSKYSFSAGMNYMHVSNGYLSEPAFYNYGINVYGPMFGLDVRLGKPHHNASQ